VFPPSTVRHRQNSLILAQEAVYGLTKPVEERESNAEMRTTALLEFARPGPAASWRLEPEVK
jgi:hypothetical protein